MSSILSVWIDPEVASLKAFNPASVFNNAVDLPVYKAFLISWLLNGIPPVFNLLKTFRFTSSGVPGLIIVNVKVVSRILFCKLVGKLFSVEFSKSFQNSSPCNLKPSPFLLALVWGLSTYCLPKTKSLNVLIRCNPSTTVQLDFSSLDT